MSVQFNQDSFLEILQKLLSIDSTTGQYREIQTAVEEELLQLDLPVMHCQKGGLIYDLGGSGDPIVVTAHLDDIGLMVRKINSDGTLNVCPVGGLYPFYCISENVRIYTRNQQVFTGTVCRQPSSIHVTEEELRETPPDFRKNVCVVIDADVSSAEEVRTLGIETGDIIALEPRFHFSNGYIKSRFIDDKACVALLIAWIKAFQDNQMIPNRKIYAYFSAYEEIGHGTSWLPNDVRDILSIDIAPTGPDQNSHEHKVSIFAKDSRFPYHWDLTNEIRQSAIDSHVNYVMDIFTPHYGTDSDTSIIAGYDVRHSAIGPGTSNSHGYERTHMDAIRETFSLLSAYLLS